MLVDKYRPRTFADIIGNPSVVEAAKQWADEWNKGRKQTPLLIYGSPGCGKTSLAHVLAKEMGWELLETNASDLRNKGSLEAVLGPAATESTLTGSRRLIVVDEVDGINASDRGAVSAIVGAIEASGQPIILVANDAHIQKLKPLREAATFLEMKAVNPKTLKSHLRRIADAERISVTDESIEEISDRAHGDVRSAMIDLMSSASHRDRGMDIFKALGIMFKAETFDSARRSMWDIDVDPEMKVLWIDENIPLEYTKSDDIHRAFEALSRADVLEGRIYKRQFWGLRRYSSDLQSAGVAAAKDSKYLKFTNYKFPSYLQKMSRTVITRAVLKSACAKIGRKTHLSIKEARQQLPLIAPFVLSNPEYFGLDSNEITFLKTQMSKSV